MKADNANSITLSGQPVRFYIDRAEIPWSIFALVILCVYLASHWIDWGYLDFLAPVSLVTQIVTVIGATYYFSWQEKWPWTVTASYSLILGLFMGLWSSFMAWIRFWDFWLFFNIVVETLISAVLALAVASAVMVILKLIVKFKPLIKL